MVYPNVSRDQLSNHWLLISVWNLSAVDHAEELYPQEFDEFLGEAAVDLSRDADEQERWYVLIPKASRPKRQLTIMDQQGCSTSSLNTSQTHIAQQRYQEGPSNQSGKKWHVYPKSAVRRKSISVDMGSKGRKLSLLPSSYVAVNPLLPRGPVGIGGAAFGRYASVSCPVS
ncbi:uncharacterized protein LOC114828399 [Galendromus occidentalis]|uniref:Uncharacterized protein LOC114828399 n=1 Tax=Galendromus occidentalis TaxID=34638 RepID=A0AAJ7SGB0_9ACAR|nr:uncharacterized protein LOC114828399 [Galendromus occidentalis]